VIFILYFYIAGVQDFLGFKFTDEALYGTYFVRPSCDPKQLLVPIQQSVIEAWMRCRKVFFCKTLIARLLQLLQALNIQYTGLSEKFSAFGARFKYNQATGADGEKIAVLRKGRARMVLI
jgi:hypothetical protein